MSEPTSQATERVNQPSGQHALSLLQLSGWENYKQYDKNNPVYMTIAVSGSSLEEGPFVSAHISSPPSSERILEGYLRSTLKTLREDNGMFPGDKYTCEETIIEISIERAR